MYDVTFNSGFIGLLIWILLFTPSTAALIFRCVWILRRKRFGSAVELMPSEGRELGRSLCTLSSAQNLVPEPAPGIFDVRRIAELHQKIAAATDIVVILL